MKPRGYIWKNSLYFYFLLRFSGLKGIRDAPNVNSLHLQDDDDKRNNSAYAFQQFKLFIVHIIQITQREKKIVLMFCNHIQKKN